MVYPVYPSSPFFPATFGEGEGISDKIYVFFWGVLVFFFFWGGDGVWKLGLGCSRNLFFACAGGIWHLFFFDIY